MPDARMASPAGPELQIADALAALPLETPERSAWPRLAERIAAGERARTPRARWPFALAAAAVLALVALLPRQGPPLPAVAEPAATAAVAEPPSLDLLMAESA